MVPGGRNRIRFAQPIVGNFIGINGVGADFSLDQVHVEGSSYESAHLSNNADPWVGGDGRRQRWSITGSNLLPTTAASCSYAGGCTVKIEGSGYPVSAPGTWWGTTDPFEINSRIYDGNDDPSLPVVTKDPIATAPHDLYAPSSVIGVAAGGSVAASAGSVSGGATDAATAASGISQVKVSLTDLQTGQSWDGSQWVDTEQFREAAGTSTWQVSIPPLADGRQYRLRSLTRDGANNIQWGASSSTFTADGTPPAAPTLSGSILLAGERQLAESEGFRRGWLDGQALHRPDLQRQPGGDRFGGGLRCGGADGVGGG